MFITFSWWHPWEPRFKSAFHNSFWDYVVPDRIPWMTLELYKWNWERVLANSFSGIHKSKIFCSVVKLDQLNSLWDFWSIVFSSKSSRSRFVTIKIVIEEMRSQNRHDEMSTSLRKTSREFAWTLTLATYSISVVEVELNYGTVPLPHLSSPWREGNRGGE